MNRIVKILIDRDGLTLDEALDVFRDMQAQVRAGVDPEEVLYSEVGLEPDYVFDLLPVVQVSK